MKQSAGIVLLVGLLVGSACSRPGEETGPGPFEGGDLGGGGLDGGGLDGGGGGDLAASDGGASSGAALCFFPDPQVYFPSPALGAPADTSAFSFGRVTISNCGNETIGFTDLTFAQGTDSAFAFELKPFTGTTTLVPNESMFVDLRFAPQSGGARSGGLSIHSDLGVKTIALSGEGITDPGTCLLAIGSTQTAAGAGSTSLSYLPRTAVGMPVTDTILLSNVGRTPCSVSAITLQDPSGVYSFPYPGQIQTPINLAFRQLKLINLRITPAAAQSYTATLELQSNDPSNGPHTLTVQGFGY